MSSIILATRAAAAALAILAVAAVVHGVQAPIGWNQACLLYQAWLVDQGGLVLYRTLFDIHPPGALLVYAIAGRLSGYDDGAVQAVDVAWLSLGIVTLALAFRRHGTVVITIAAGALVIRLMHPNYRLEREAWVIPVLFGTVWLLTRATPGMLAAALAGAGFGFASMIKPPLAAGVLPAAVHLWLAVEPARRARAMGALAAGVLMPIAGFAIYLWWMGTLGAFLQMAWNYWPLYGAVGLGEVSGEPTIGRMAARVLERAPENLRPWWTLAVGAASGLWLLRSSPQWNARREPAVLVAGFLIVYAAYPLMQGHASPNQWIPFLWCGIALTALGAGSVSQPAARWRSAVAGLLLVLVLWRQVMAPGVFIQIPEDYIRDTDELTAALRQAHQGPPAPTLYLAFAGAPLLVALRERTPPATSFIFDWPFYHHTSDPYIRGLRGRFIAEFDAAPPVLIVQLRTGVHDLVRDGVPFTALDERVARDYGIVAQTAEYNVYRRISR